MPESALEELGQEEHGAEQRGEHQEARAVAGRERARSEQRGRQHRRARAAFPGHEAGQQGRARCERRDDFRAAPAGAVAAHEAPHDPECRAGDQREPRQVERILAARALRDPGEHDRHGQQPDRDVDPEDPLPREPIGHGAADHGPARDREAGEALQDTHSAAAPFGREGGADERERERHHERRAGALNGARDDQPAGVRRQRAGRRGEREQREPTGEQAPPPVAIAERGRSQQQHREAEVVGVDGPLELLDGRAEVEADGGQRRGDHEGVQRDHEGGDGGQAQDPAAGSAFGGHAQLDRCRAADPPVSLGRRAGLTRYDDRGSAGPGRGAGR